MHRFHRATASVALAFAVTSGFAACSGERAEEMTDTAASAVGSAAGTVAGAVENAFRIERVELGRSLGSDNRIASGTSEFKPNETVYAVIETNAIHANRPMIARFTTEDGTLVEEQTETINAIPNDRAIAVFKLSRPNGWAVGKYRVSFWHEGKEMESENFEIKQ